MPTTRPKVHVVATGGSISGIGPDRLDYLLYPELGQGFLGYVDSEGHAVFYRDVTRRHTAQTPFDVRGRETLPRVPRRNLIGPTAAARAPLGCKPSFVGDVRTAMSFCHTGVSTPEGGIGSAPRVRAK
jgi:hypothetical protein